MRILGAILLTLGGIYGVVVIAAALWQRQLMYPGAYKSAGADLAGRPPGTEVVDVRTSDGERQRGLWHPPQAGCGVVLSFHGNGSRPEPHAERFSQGPWGETGWGVLAIAYRGYPGSTGSPSEAGLIRDGMAAYALVAKRAPGAPILLHGHSLGAAVAIAVAERAAHLGLYLEAPFDSMIHVVRRHYPFLPTRWLLRDTYRSDERIRSGNEPVLIVQGDRDGIVPARLSRALAAAAGPRARLDLVAGDHVSILGERDGEAEALFRSLVTTRCRPAAAAH